MRNGPVELISSAWNTTLCLNGDIAVMNSLKQIIDNSQLWVALQFSQELSHDIGITFNEDETDKAQPLHHQVTRSTLLPKDLFDEFAVSQATMTGQHVYSMLTGKSFSFITNPFLFNNLMNVRQSTFS